MTETTENLESSRRGRPPRVRRAVVLLAATAALIAATATTADAAPRPARSVDGCSLNFGGGYVSTTVTNEGPGRGHYANLTITQHNGSPHAISFDWNRISDSNGNTWRGISHLEGRETQTWVAAGVWIDAGTAWSGSAFNRHGSDWNTCDGIGS